MFGGFYEDGWEVEIDIVMVLCCYLCVVEGGDFCGKFNVVCLLVIIDCFDEVCVWM